MQETISFEQMSSELNIPRHIIHLWTKKFPIFSPLRTSEGKISFKPRDVSFAKGLKKLLIDEKQNIKDVQKLLNERGIAHIIDIGKSVNPYFDKANSNNEAFSSISSTHRKVANEVFKNISHIFTKDNFASNTLPSVVNTSLPTMLNQIPNQSIPNQSPEMPPPLEIVGSNPSEGDKVSNDYEDKWRHLMEKKGKATPIDIAKNKMHEVSYDDIWEIDDNEEDIDLFQYELETIENTDDKMQSLTDNHYVKEQYPSKRAAHKAGAKEVNPKSSGGDTTSIEKIEKIKHLISKLEILKDELESSGVVISKTLKIFGYNGIGGR